MAKVPFPSKVKCTFLKRWKLKINISKLLHEIKWKLYFICQNIENNGKAWKQQLLYKNKVRKMSFNYCQLHSSLHFKGKKNNLNMQCEVYVYINYNYNSQILITLLIN